MLFKKILTKKGKKFLAFSSTVLQITGPARQAETLAR